MTVNVDDEKLWETIVARSLIYTRSQMVATQIANDYSPQLSGKATDVIKIQRPTERNSYDINPSITDPSVDVVKQEYIEMPVREWRGSSFTITDSDLLKIINSDEFIPMTLQSSLDSLIEDVNTHILNQYIYFYGVVGTAGVTPFASSRDEAVDCGTALTRQKVLKSNRYLILNTDAESNALKLPELTNFNIVGNPNTITEAVIGRKLGFNWVLDQTLPYHTNGGATGVLVNGAFSAGVKQISIDTGSGAINIGDIFTIAGHTQTYTCMETVLDSSAASLKFEPALQANILDNSAITFIGDHAVNLAVHKMALAYAFADFEKSRANNTMDVMMRDQDTGMNLRLEIKRQHKQDFYELDAKFGAAVTSPHLGVRLLG